MSTHSEKFGKVWQVNREKTADVKLCSKIIIVFYGYCNRQQNMALVQHKIVFIYSFSPKKDSSLTVLHVQPLIRRRL